MKQIILPFALFFFMVFGFASCDLPEVNKKDVDQVEDSGYLQVYADQAQNSVLTLWDKAIAEASLEGGRTIAIQSVESDDDLTEVCGIKATMDLTNIRPILSVNFGSFRCEYFNIIRQGDVILELLEGSSISEKNSVAKFTFINFKVTDILTGKYVVYNGSKVITNLSGGVLTDLRFGDPDLIHKVRSQGFRIRYSSSTADIIKNTARNVTFKKLDISNNYRMIIKGDTAINGVNNVSDWGTLRNGTPYHHIITNAIWYESCSKHCRFIRGQRVQKIEGGRETTILFGVDKFGALQQNCGAYGNLVYYFNAEGDSVATIMKNLN